MTRPDRTWVADDGTEWTHQDPTWPEAKQVAPKGPPPERNPMSTSYRIRTDTRPPGTPNRSNDD